ncbi:Ryanodine receptor 3 [Larimichthys crocea]|uniref:Uncharacterized protein n=1 Tax=Larimichthys crocea TaxID=215358 RepID=A0ACD3RQ25_LARCR|nr:Ryanodine receptor 3 [Larimichthys crocea]
MAEGGEGEDEIQFLRTDDEVVLQCVACIQKENRKFCLAAEGLGNRLCYLEPTSEAKVQQRFSETKRRCLERQHSVPSKPEQQLLDELFFQGFRDNGTSLWARRQMIIP